MRRLREKCCREVQRSFFRFRVREALVRAVLKEFRFGGAV